MSSSVRKAAPSLAGFLAQAFACLLCLLLPNGLLAGPQDGGPAAAPESSAAVPLATAVQLLTVDRQRELFDALDLSVEALKPVGKAVADRDFPGAIHLLADYFRRRASVPWYFDPRNPQRNPGFRDRTAEEATIGRVQGGAVPLKHDFPGGNIDWMDNPTLSTPGIPHNNEWQWQLCRMNFWVQMGNAYRATGDERYAQAWVRQFRSFIAECPPPAGRVDGLQPRTAWRGLEVGIRMADTWPGAYHSFLLSPEWTDEDMALYLGSCLAHARYLRKFQGTANRLAKEMAGLYTVGALYPEFKEAQDWREFSLDKMHAEETAQFLPDGAQFELSPGYQNVTVDDVLKIASLAQLTGRMGEVPPDYIDRIEKAFDYELYLLTPDGFLPKFNDSWTISAHDAFAKAPAFFPDRPEYQWAAGGGGGHPPAETSRAFPWAGFCVMRSDWASDGNELILRAGPLGHGHYHYDKLSVLLWAFGRELLFDSGGGSYEDSKWRAYSIDTFSHNTVLVDGQPQRVNLDDPGTRVSPAPLDLRWESLPDHDFAAGVYEGGYGSAGSRPAVHARRVLFVKPDLFIVADTLTPNDEAEHVYQARWHLLTTRTRIDGKTHTVVTDDAGLANMAIVPLRSDGLEVRAVSAQTEPELLGWNVRKDQDPPNVAATTVLHTLKGKGVRTFLTLLVPLRPGSPDPVADVRQAGSDSALVVFADGRKLAVAASLDPRGGIEATETLPDASPGRHVQGGVPH